MGNLLYSLTATENSLPPTVPPPKNAQTVYIADPKAWESETKRIKKSMVNFDVLRRDVKRLNLILRFLTSPPNAYLLNNIDTESQKKEILKNNNHSIPYVLKCQILTKINTDSSFQKIFKFGFFFVLFLLSCFRCFLGYFF